MRIVIVGAGAMGCLFAGYLARSSENEIFLLEKNREAVDSIRKKGIKISGKTKLAIPRGKIKIKTNVRGLSYADIIIFLVKSYDTASAAKNVAPLISKNTSILTLQNGLNNMEIIKKHSIAKSLNRSITDLFVGTTSHASTLIGYGRIKHTGEGETIIADEVGRAEKIKEVLEKSGIETRLVKDVDSVLWSKLLVNSSINPVGAIFNLKNGEILKNKAARGIMLKAAEEVFHLCRLRKTKLFYKNPFKMVIDVCKRTSENKNSMLQDLAKGRKTEVESISGAVVKEAGKFHLKLPVNETLYSIIKSQDC